MSRTSSYPLAALCHKAFTIVGTALMFTVLMFTVVCARNLTLDTVAFEWVKAATFNKLKSSENDEKTLTARVEIATCRAFNITPPRWAKEQLIAAVEKNIKKLAEDVRAGRTSFEKESQKVEKKLYAVNARIREIEDRIRNTDEWNPAINAGLLWNSAQRKATPANSAYKPLAVSLDEMWKITNERKRIYHKFGKETPEEKLGGGIAILLAPMLIGAGSSSSVGVRSALTNLSKAESALIAGRTEAALSAVTKARSTLGTTTGFETAKIAVGEANTALIKGQFGKATKAINTAQSILKGARIKSINILPIENTLKTETEIDNAYGTLLRSLETKDFLDEDKSIAIIYRAQYYDKKRTESPATKPAPEPAPVPQIYVDNITAKDASKASRSQFERLYLPLTVAKVNVSPDPSVLDTKQASVTDGTKREGPGNKMSVGITGGTASTTRTDHWPTVMACQDAKANPNYYPTLAKQRPLANNETVKRHPTGGCFEMDLPDRLGGRGFVRIEKGRDFVVDRTTGAVLRLAVSNNAVYSWKPFPTEGSITN